MKICERCFGSNEMCYVCRGQNGVSSFISQKSKSTKSKRAKRDKPVLSERERAVLARILLDRSALPTEKCPMCNVLVACKRLEQHMLSKCPARQKKENIVRTIETTKQVKRICPHCGIPVSADSFEGHLKQGCGVRQIQTAELDCSDSPLAYQRSESDISDEAFRQEFIDSHDATRGMGQTIRDNGAFGSHPSHDDHGDESFS